MGKLILLADDNEHARIAAQRVLEIAGYQVLAAKDGAEALELAVIHQPALGVFDMTMPKLHGHEVCAELRKRDDELARLPIIMLTGVDELMGGALAESAGAQKYLGKPVNPRELLDAVAVTIA